MTQGGRGPFGWSTSRVLARRSSVFCWDVNGYYRDLGIPAPYVDATISDIRRAFLARDGQNDARLMMIFVTFLDPQTKARYDAMPLGSRFMDGPELLAQKLRDLAARQRGEIADHDWVTEPVVPLDSQDEQGQDESSPAKESTPEPYPFTVLLRGTSTYNPLVLEQWQGLLIDAVQRYGGPSQIGLGVMENQGTSWVIGDVHDATAVLLDRYLRPTQTEAERIVLSCQGLQGS